MKLALAVLLWAAPASAWELQDRSEWRCYGNEQACAKNPNWADSDLRSVGMDPNKVRIIVHHTADSAGVLPSEDPKGRDVLAGIYKQHKARKWATIGYHFVVDKHGRVWEARPVDRLGAHVTENRKLGIGNTGSIGISVVGDFETEDLTRAQFDNLKNLIAWLTSKYGIPLDKVITHHDVEATACPGRNLHSKEPVPAMARIQPRLPAILTMIWRGRQPKAEQLVVGRGPFARVIRN